MDKPFDEFQTETKLDEFCAKMHRAHAEWLEAVTENQFAAIISQIIKSGDFTRLIHDDGTRLSYLPFREKMALEARIRSLEEENKQVRFYQKK